MGLFFGGLRRQIEALTGELDALRNSVAQAKKESAEMSKELKQRDESIRREREGRKKTEQKVAKLTKAKQDSDQKQKDQTEQIEHLQSELSLFRKSMLDARSESEGLKARLMKFERIEVSEPVDSDGEGEGEGEEAKATSDSTDRERAPRPMSARQIDRRIERLQEIVAQERDDRDDLRDRVGKAEGARRDADRRRVSEANKFEAMIRDLQHGLRSERRAYKVLQLQYEAQIERLRGMEQVSGESTEVSTDIIETADEITEVAVASPEAPEAEVVETQEVDAEAKEAEAVESSEIEIAPSAEDDEKVEAESTPEG